MKTLWPAFAAALFCGVLLPPGEANAFEWSLPASYQRISLHNPSAAHDLTGVYVPAVWLGGPLGPLALHFAGGYAHQTESRTGISADYITTQAALDLELEGAAVVPYAGMLATAWYPVRPASFLRGWPLMAGPHAGVRFSLLRFLELDVSAFGSPWNNVWNVSDEQGRSYLGQTWAIGGKVSLRI